MKYALILLILLFSDSTNAYNEDTKITLTYKAVTTILYLTCLEGYIHSIVENTKLRGDKYIDKAKSFCHTKIEQFQKDNP